MFFLPCLCNLLLLVSTEPQQEVVSTRAVRKVILSLTGQYFTEIHKELRALLSQVLMKHSSPGPS